MVELQKTLQVPKCISNVMSLCKQTNKKSEPETGRCEEYQKAIILTDVYTFFHVTTVEKKSRCY